MQTTSSASLAKNICKRLPQFRRARGGLVPSLEPRKQETNTSEVKMNTIEKAYPIAAFSWPPPFSPFIGPLVAISLLETWSDHDDDK
ncbi:hypothetical protein V2J09_003183 [Rumex salicifolius]